MHCIKCAEIMKKVLCFHFDDLKREIGLNKYSLLLSESNYSSNIENTLDFNDLL